MMDFERNGQGMVGATDQNYLGGGFESIVRQQAMIAGLQTQDAQKAKDYVRSLRLLMNERLIPSSTDRDDTILLPAQEVDASGNIIIFLYRSSRELLNDYMQSFSLGRRSKTTVGGVVPLYQDCFHGVWGERHRPSAILSKIAYELDESHQNLMRHDPFFAVAVAAGGEIAGCIWGFRTNILRGLPRWFQRDHITPSMWKQRMDALREEHPDIAEGSDATLISEAFVNPAHVKSGAVVLRLIRDIMKQEMGAVRYAFGRTIDLPPGAKGTRPPMAKLLEAFGWREFVPLGLHAESGMEYNAFIGEWKSVGEVLSRPMFSRFLPERRQHDSGLIRGHTQLC